MSEHIKCQERIISAYDEQNNTTARKELTKLPWSELQLKLQIIRSQDSTAWILPQRQTPTTFHTSLIYFDIPKLLANEGQTTLPRVLSNVRKLRSPKLPSPGVQGQNFFVITAPLEQGMSGRPRETQLCCCPSCVCVFLMWNHAQVLLWQHSADYLSPQLFISDSELQDSCDSKGSAPDKPCWAVLCLHQGSKCSFWTHPAALQGVVASESFLHGLRLFLMFSIHIIAAQQLMKTISYNT